MGLNVGDRVGLRVGLSVGLWVGDSSSFVGLELALGLRVGERVYHFIWTANS